MSKALSLYTDVARARVYSYTIEQVAELLGCTVSNVDNIHSQGRADHSGQARVYLHKLENGQITRESLLKYIAAVNGLADKPYQDNY